jgi:hypothetical protein
LVDRSAWNDRTTAGEHEFEGQDLDAAIEGLDHTKRENDMDDTKEKQLPRADHILQFFKFDHLPVHGDEPKIVCAHCGIEIPDGHAHICGEIGSHLHPSSKTQIGVESGARYRRIERSAQAAVKRFGDIVDAEKDDVFGELMIDLARALVEGTR